jgi:hypothetical protein
LHGGGGAGGRWRAHQGGREECQARGSPLSRLAEVGASQFPRYFFPRISVIEEAIFVTCSPWGMPLAMLSNRSPRKP